MIQSTKNLLDLLDECEMAYNHHTMEESQIDVVLIELNSEKMPLISAMYAFDTDGQGASLKIVDIVEKISPNKLNELLPIINAFNLKYRFAKVCLDTDDWSIRLDMDTLFSSQIAGVVCLKLLQMAIPICEQVYQHATKILQT